MATFTNPTSPSQILDAFMLQVEAKKLSLYPAQEEAILQLYDGANVILNTPTGSGKSLVAQALHFLSLHSGKVSYYTCPIKALVNEKFLALCRDFGPEHVGMITGDATVNAEAPIICCTAEILANLALREGSHAKVADVIMDEFHYYSDRERGVAWQIPLLTMSQTRFLLMSATLGDVDFFEKKLTELNGLPTQMVRSLDRPVPLDYSYAEVPLHESLQTLITQGRSPVYLVNFTQRECAEMAQNLMSVDFCSKDEKRSIAELIGKEDFSSPYGKEISKFLRHGIGLHHAGLLPKYRVLIEKLAQRGLLKIISGTDTLGVGVNIPIRTVLFTKLCKFDGQKTTLLSVRDFHQIGGRAGRKGFDDRGFVVVQAPEHVIENLRLDVKAAASPGGKKFVRKKPPEKGFVNWTKESFEQLKNRQPEELKSQFNIQHGMLLNVLSRDHEDGCRALQKIIRHSHETPNNKRKLGKRAFTLFRSLVERGIIEFAVSSGPRKRLIVNVDLQQDFSLNQTLSLYLLDTLKLLDRNDPEHALNVISLAESILEQPEVILRKQVDRLKTEKMAELKMAGVEYDQRIEELEKIEHPKPLREFIYNSFNEFSDKHPWVGTENIRPKSIGREMFEASYSFADYIREYEIQRAEGILLRYVSELYKVLVQTVPEADRSDEILEVIAYFKGILQSTDSSLIDEWERMRNPLATNKQQTQNLPQTRTPAQLMASKDFKVQIKNAVFQILRAIANRDAEALSKHTQLAMDAETLWASMDEYYTENALLDLSPRARNAEYLNLVPDAANANNYVLNQTLCDEEGPVNWVLTINLDMEASNIQSVPVLTLLQLEKI